MKTLWHTLIGKIVLLLTGVRLAGLAVVVIMRDWSAVVDAIGLFLLGLVGGATVLGFSYRNRLAPDNFIRFGAGTFAIVAAIALVLGTAIAFAHSCEEWLSSFMAAGLLPVSVWTLIKVRDGSRLRMFQQSDEPNADTTPRRLS